MVPCVRTAEGMLLGRAVLGHYEATRLFSIRDLTFFFSHYYHSLAKKKKKSF